MSSAFLETDGRRMHAITVAAAVAPEDLQRGDFVAVLSEVIECPMFIFANTFTCDDDPFLRVERLPIDERYPLKIKAICVPFVFIETPKRQFETLDIRQVQLARLSNEYGKAVWKKLRKKKKAKGKKKKN